jgi:hypothetical protein
MVVVRRLQTRYVTIFGAVARFNYNIALIKEQ